MNEMFIVVAYDHGDGHIGGGTPRLDVGHLIWFPNPCLFKTEIEAKTLCHVLKKSKITAVVRRVEVGGYSKKTIKEIFGA